jgi:N-acetylglucosaminyl-diphospho-decaprenol L-rhamnosyltransferase
LNVSESPQLSILIVNWNGREMLRDLLASIDVTRGDLAIQTIVVDNASSDGSAEMVEREFPAVRLERSSQNLGFARGNNQAASAADAPLILLLNNDARVRARALQNLVEFMGATPDVAAAGPQLIGADGNPQRSARDLPTLAALLNSIQFLKWTGLFRRAYRRYRLDAFDAQKPCTVGQLAAAALILRKADFQKIGGFDEGFVFGVEDVDLCFRLKSFGQIYYVPSAQIEHLGRVSSRANRGWVYRSYECGWARYLQKHHGNPAAFIYKVCVTFDMPIRLIVLTFQWTIQSLRGKREKASRTRGRLAAAAQFLVFGLPDFWNA